AAALAAVVTRHAIAERLCQDREPRRDARDTQPVARVLDQQLVTAWAGRRLEDAVRVVGQSLATAEDADQPIDAVVIRCDVVVANGPVVAEAVDASATEVVRTETQRDATPVVRPSAEHACAPPVERLARCHRVRLTVDLPAADASVELAERLVGGRCAASG